MSRSGRTWCSQCNPYSSMIPGWPMHVPLLLLLLAAAAPPPCNSLTSSLPSVPAALPSMRRLTQELQQQQQQQQHVSQHDQWTHSHADAMQPRVPASDSPTPWLLPPSVVLRYEGLHNDLTALIRVQRTGERWLTVFMFSSGVSWWAMNAVYSYIRYGRSTSYIMAAPDAASLTACLQLRLPCLNMSAAGIRVAPTAADETAATATAHGWKTAAYFALVWAKVDLVTRILRTSTHVHFSDIDVVFLRDVWPSYRHVFRTAGPDAVFMQEGWQVGRLPQEKSNLYINMFNTGVYAIRANSRSIAFMEQWYGSGSQQAGNQPYINGLLAHPQTAVFALCTSALSCNLVRRSRRAALFLHPPQSEQAACPPFGPLTAEEACADDRLFIHYICSPGGWGAKGPGSKGTMLDEHQLRLLNARGQPLYREDEPEQRQQQQAEGRDAAGRQAGGEQALGEDGGQQQGDEDAAAWQRRRRRRRLAEWTVEWGAADEEGEGGGRGQEAGAAGAASEGEGAVAGQAKAEAEGVEEEEEEKEEEEEEEGDQELPPRHPFLPCVQREAWRWAVPRDRDQRGKPYLIDMLDRIRDPDGF